MEWTLDLILAVVLAVFLLIGIRRGLVRSAVHFVGSIIASLLASALGGTVARWAWVSLFRESLVQRVEDTVSAAGAGSVIAGLQNFFNALPDFLLRMMEDAGVTLSTLEGMLSHSADRAGEVVADALSPMFIGFLKVLAVLVLFLLFMLFVRVLADLVGRVFRLPVLRGLDRALGGLFGLLLGLVLIWVGISAVQVFLPMLTPDTQADIEIALNRSLIAGWLIDANPLTGLF